MLIGLLDTDQYSAGNICNYLQCTGHEVRVLITVPEMLLALKSCSIDLLLVATSAGDKSGLELLTSIRNECQLKGPVLFLINRRDEHNVGELLKAGLNDYCLKPVRAKELLTRVSACLGNTSQVNIFDVKKEYLGYVFDVLNSSVVFGGKRVNLSQPEFHLAMYFFENRERALSRSQLLQAAYRESSDGESLPNSLDMLVSSLRKKLDTSITSPVLRLKQIYGFGYRLTSLI
jgi:DNA-binding response OmpR family regulator